MIPIDNGEKKSGEKDSLLWSYGLECRAQQVIFRVGRTVSTPRIPPDIPRKSELIIVWGERMRRTYREVKSD